MAEADGYPAQEQSASESVGSRLRAARERAGKSLAQLAEETRIPQRHIVSMETGDFAALPARPYAIGFARTLARTLGLDEQATLEQARDAFDAQDPAEPERTVQQFEVGDPAKTPGGATVWIAVAVALLVVAAGVVFWRGYYAPGGGLPPLVDTRATVGEASRQQAAVRPQQAPAASAAAPAGGAVVFTATADKIWVKFYDGAGKQLMQKQMALGESYTVPADAQGPKVWTGRPDALSITVGGNPVPPLSVEQKTMKDVPVSASALLARAEPAPASPQPAQSGSSTATM